KASYWSPRNPPRAAHWPGRMLTCRGMSTPAAGSSWQRTAPIDGWTTVGSGRNPVFIVYVPRSWSPSLLVIERTSAIDPISSATRPRRGRPGGGRCGGAGPRGELVVPRELRRVDQRPVQVFQVLPAAQRLVLQ